MKKFFLVLSLMASSAYACPNFSGEYVSEEFGTYYAITQNSCDEIFYHYDEGDVERPLDGKEYLVNQYDIVVEEGKVLATVKIFESNKMTDKKLITTARSETLYASGDIDRDEGSSYSYLDKNANLVTVSKSNNGKQTTIDRRVK